MINKIILLIILGSFMIGSYVYIGRIGSNVINDVGDKSKSEIIKMYDETEEGYNLEKVEK